MIHYVDPETKKEGRGNGHNLRAAQRRHYLETRNDRPDIRHANAYARWHKPLEEWAKEIPEVKIEAEVAR